MPLNPLAPVTDYQSMLNRIFWFTSACALACVWLLRKYIPALDAALAQVDEATAFGGTNGAPTPGGYLLPALAVGILTRVFHVHARISDLLGIRECFDLKVIIGELARQAGVDLGSVEPSRMRAARRSLMRKTFYAFVSGPQPHIDQRLVEQALDAWSWFWIGVETTLLFTLTGFALVACGAGAAGAWSLYGAASLALVGLPAIRGQCRRYAAAQVRAILDDAGRAAAVRQAFAELRGEDARGRRAA